jgi:ABC-type nitrate/sulfonate/bicarbonate transport system substrate-binding protein/nitrogen-specific signal transduction histidine kinase
MMLRFLSPTLLLCALFFVPAAAHSTETVRLQLKWQHQFQFAGYYAAKHLGYYRDAGLDVEFIEPGPGINATDIVLRGEAEYGVGNSGILLYRNAGAPVVVLAVIMQHSPFILLTRQDATLNGIRDLAGKRLMLEPMADEVEAFLKHEGVPLDSFREVSQDLHDLEPFISGEVEAIDAYITDEPYELMIRGVPFNLFHPRAAGIDFYGDNLFTTEYELSNHPDRVQRFRQASLQGWRYAMDHPDEIIDLIVHHYKSELSRDALVFEAQQMQQLIHPELIDIGYMLEQRWRHIAATYAELGMLPKAVSLEGFLYEEPRGPDLFWFYAVSLGTLGVLAIVSLVAWRFVRLNRQLSRLLRVKNQFANVGESVNHIAHQWKQPLHELGIQLMRIRQLVSSDAPAQQTFAEVMNATDRGHELLDFMADTVDAFGRVLNTRHGDESFAPQTVVDDVLHLLQDSLAEQRIAIDYSPRDEAMLHGNPTDFAQALLSILTNAREILAERAVRSPCIRIESRVEQGRFVLAITDNGGGITARNIDDIFTLGVSNKRTPDTGVGLYIARELVQGFGGTLGARNEGEGAVFTLSVPLFSGA